MSYLNGLIRRIINAVTDSSRLLLRPIEVSSRIHDELVSYNAWVRRLLCEFAQAAGRSRCALKDKFQALNVRKGHKRSFVALGHKMLRTIYAMLSKNTHYVDKTVDYYVDRKITKHD